MNSTLTGFAAYPSSLREVRETLSRLPAELSNKRVPISLKIWENNDIAGYCLVDPIIEQIGEADFVLADITHLNFNVVYEIGYAIGKSKRVVLLQNRAMRQQTDLMRELGLFDTVGWYSYENTNDLCSYLANLNTVRPIRIPDKKKGGSRPFFVIWPSERTESEIRLLSRIKKQARVGFQQFDPKEDVRLPVGRALDEVVNAYGIILPLISSNRQDAVVHNIRCAFVAGLSHALDKETLILQAGREPVPLDLRDAVSFYSEPESIDRLLSDFTPRVFEKTLQHAQAEFPALITPIQKLQVGASAAENEHDDLASYFIQTEEFQRVVRGEVQVVTGRKGSGKTALFYQVRNKIRNDKRNVVLDLNPEGFQLRKFKTLVLERMEAGTREHTITAFWEYLLFLEICYKLLEKDQRVHLHDHTLRAKYIELQKLYISDAFISEGDFAERLLHLLDAIEQKFQTVPAEDQRSMLTRGQLTEFIYQHDIEGLRKAIINYLSHKSSVWILFDNIDKGWSAHGVDESDLVNLRCLIEALRKVSRDFGKAGIVCKCVTFIRNDIYENLIDATPDRGKLNRVSLDWTDKDLLRELLRRRFLYSLNLTVAGPDFDTLWNSFSVSHLLDGNDTSEYLISRSLMRPRSLLDFLYYCKSHAVNLGHSRIEDSDFRKGEESFSTELVNGISLEIQDVLPAATNALFAFVECGALIDRKVLDERLHRIVKDSQDKNKLLDLLLWYGFIGVVRQSLEETFIYSVGYDSRKLKALMENVPEDSRLFVINPAFHKGLDIES